MAAPWLSVLVPCHNGARWLAEALQSVADQREEGLEVILIDSSPDEACSAIIDRFSGVLKLRALRRPDLVPWTAKTNLAAKLAEGEHICMLHQDDLWLPNRCAELRQWVARRPDGVMHLQPCYIIDEAGRRLGLWRCPLPADSGAPVPAHLIYERLLVQNFVGIPAPMIRRETYVAVGGLDEALWYTADWDLYLKIAGFGAVYYHSNPLACFRIHKNSLTVAGSRNSADFKSQHKLVVDRHCHNIAPEHRPRVLRIANASVAVNAALAGAMAGKFAEIGRAAVSVLALGPAGMRQYVFWSRIVDRAIPRLRALIAGRF